MAADSTTSRFSTNVWALTISQIVFRFATIVVFGYIGQRLGAHVLGQYAIVMGVLNLYMSFSDLGVSNFVIKEVSQDRTLGEIYLDNFFVLQIFVGFIIVALALITGNISGYSAAIMGGLAVGAIGLIFNGMSNAYRALLAAQERLFPFAIIEIVCIIVYVIGNSLVVIFHLGLMALVGVTVGVQVTKYIIGMLWAKRFNARVKLRANRKTMGRMLWLGLPFLLFNSAHFAVQRLDVILIGSLASEALSGEYAAASRLVYSSLFVIGVIGSALFPIFSRLIHENRAKVPELYYRATNYVYIVAALAGLLFYVLAPLIIQIVFGEEFESSITVLRIIAWYVPCFAIGLFASNILMVGNHVWPAARASILGVLVMAASVFLVFPAYSLNGVALVVVLVEAMLSVVYISLLKKHFNISIIPTKTIQTTIALILATALHYILPESDLYVSSAASVGLFVGLVFVMRVLKYEDVVLIARILLKRPVSLA